MFEIHPSAKENFESKAKALLPLVKAIATQPHPPKGFPSETHVAYKITEENIIGEIGESTTDYRGRTIEKFFRHNGSKFGLKGPDYEKLSTLAESIQRLPTFRAKLSLEFIEESLFSWIKETYTHQSEARSFNSYLILKATEAVEPITTYVPIANTIVEAPFEFCGTTIRNISKATIDELMAISDSVIGEDQKKSSAEFFEDFRKKYQGFATVESHLKCEPNFANTFSIQKAKAITDLLGIYSGSILIPDIKCVSRIKGTENVEGCTVILKTSDNHFSVKSQILDQASFGHRKISIRDLEGYRNCGLSTLSELYKEESNSNFESSILNMAFLYSKAAFTADPMAKLVYMLSALESILLRNENEAIQQNISERLAIFISQELAQRKAIIKNIKTVYGLRSRYLHHGHSSEELSQLSEFFLNVWQFYVRLVNNSKIFKRKVDFLNAIDDHKLS